MPRGVSRCGEASGRCTHLRRPRHGRDRPGCRAVGGPRDCSAYATSWPELLCLTGRWVRDVMRRSLGSPTAELRSARPRCQPGRERWRPWAATLALMVSIEEAAQMAMALPEVVEGTMWGHRNWSLAGKVFAWERPLSKADIKRFRPASPPGRSSRYQPMTLAPHATSLTPTSSSTHRAKPRPSGADRGTSQTPAWQSVCPLSRCAAVELSDEERDLAKVPPKVVEPQCVVVGRVS